ncbi:hypothetical protein Acr_21g0008720 [Actinidia rufa]|uniref:Wall-associated receptor kinase galacturonan-binding domain-containing protein n=1 Tax=Actinidia rufa TaxID=165716 RepID=A0A7J0GHH9_9ERIC|nr:hypothetical protein Acr_21g0008720 [Actinidia rufa]
MNTRTQTQKLLFFAVCIVPSIFTHAQTNCNGSCGFGPPKRLQYPFGFSPACPIQLNCSGNGTVLIDEFPVQSVTADAILITIPAKCDRPIKTLHRLFSSHYAPTSRNGILLQNCTSPIRTCTIPSTSVQTHLELGDCGPKGKISCYSEGVETKREFIDYVNVTSSGCESLFSAISVEALGNGSSAVALDVQVVELGWWLQGGCLCSQNAKLHGGYVVGRRPAGFPVPVLGRVHLVVPLNLYLGISSQIGWVAIEVTFN